MKFLIFFALCFGVASAHFLHVCHRNTDCGFRGTCKGGRCDYGLVHPKNEKHDGEACKTNKDCPHPEDQCVDKKCVHKFHQSKESCETDHDCPHPEDKCIDGKCVHKKTIQGSELCGFNRIVCPKGTRCGGDFCFPIIPPKKHDGEACKTSKDCPHPEDQCIDNKCVHKSPKLDDVASNLPQTCVTVKTCPSGTTACINNVCYPPIDPKKKEEKKHDGEKCETSKDCPHPEDQCIDNKCVHKKILQTEHCGRSLEKCPKGTRCVGDFCIPRNHQKKDEKTHGGEPCETKKDCPHPHEDRCINKKCIHKSHDGGPCETRHDCPHPADQCIENKCVHHHPFGIIGIHP